ncbi:hypothetical protein EIP91_005102 [Steccherinum ochraceum]|uniref:BTB domain-containing protein n=1 Tax=Steccherinum ochraceum TaxID=92696 RepID=A0A4V2MVW1_9APHY|nr:hypothetical protein EIP91_005102 [Steccherinum ochraceum]
MTHIESLTLSNQQHIPVLEPHVALLKLDVLCFGLSSLMAQRIPLTKRRRRDSDDAGSSPPKRDELAYKRGSPWLEDGNIILVAEGTAFRVLQSILSNSSEVFRDMFSVPQPTDAEKLDGVPVVQMPDSKRDLSRVLNALFDGGNLYLGQQPHFTTVCSLLRLGTKYQLAALRKDAADRLEKCFPKRLRHFNNSLSTVSSPPNLAGWIVDFANVPINIKFSDAIAVVHLAQECDLPYLLPTALFICSQLGPEKLAHGYRDRDGTLWKLAPRDLERCLLGTESLREIAQRQQAFVIQTILSPVCIAPQWCTTDLLTLRTQRLKDMKCVGGKNPLLDDGWIKSPDRGLCNRCKNWYAEHYGEQHREAWCSLATLFKVDKLVPVWPAPYTAEDLKIL